MLGRIGPKSNTELMWQWGGFRPLLIAARKQGDENEKNTNQYDRLLADDSVETAAQHWAALFRAFLDQNLAR